METNTPVMSTVATTVVNILLLNAPNMYEKLLGPAIWPRTHNTVAALPEVFAALKSVAGAYCVICAKQVLICGALIHSVITAISKQDPSKGFTSTACDPLPWVAGMMSMLFGIASIFLSFTFASSLRFVLLSNTSMFGWIQNARQNASSPWKNLPALLAAPSALCAWSVIFFIIHATGWKQCDSITGREYALLKMHFLGPWNLKIAIIACACLSWAYTIHVARAFAQLNDFTPRHAHRV